MYKLTHYLMRITLLFMSGLVLVGCSNKADNTQGKLQTITVTAQASVTPLYFNGTIEPLQTFSISAPYNGVVSKKYFNYGQEVKQGQLLLAISSSQLQDDYETALTDYLKQRQDYNNIKVQMEGTEALQKMKIISQNEYISAKDQAYDAELSYQQAVSKIKNILRKGGVSSIDFSKLESLPVGEAAKLLPKQANSINIYASAPGIVLMPGKESSGGGDSNVQTINVGTQIKQDQPMLTIGDMSGTALTIKVSEVYINDIKAGQKATVTGDAFQGITLQGQVTQVNEQATSDQSSGSPSFPVVITVPKLTQEEKKIIHVGMSAKVTLQITKPAIIQVPIAAVYTENDQTFVKVLDKTTGKPTAVPVKAGNTSLSTVEITEGLKSGDQVVVNAANN